MVLLIHILIAIASIAFSTYLFFSPSRAKFRASLGLVAATLASGFYLVASHPVQITRTCVTGLTYLGAVAMMMAFAHRKIVAQEKANRR